MLLKRLANDYSMIIKKADKGSCVVVWDRNDYIVEAEKQLRDKNTQDVNLSDKNLPDLVDKSNHRRVIIIIGALSLKVKLLKKNSSTLHMNVKKLLI